jgi:hypothetical protein
MWCVDDLRFIFGDIKFLMLMVTAQSGGHNYWYKVLKNVILPSKNAEARPLVGTSGVPFRDSSPSLYKLQYKSKA